MTALHASGAEDESEILWSNLIPGLSLARNRFRFLARRFGAGDGSSPSRATSSTFLRARRFGATSSSMIGSSEVGESSNPFHFVSAENSSLI